jgi:hypothetical protein
MDIMKQRSALFAICVLMLSCNVTHGMKRERLTLGREFINGAIALQEFGQKNIVQNNVQKVNVQNNPFLFDKLVQAADNALQEDMVKENPLQCLHCPFVTEQNKEALFHAEMHRYQQLSHKKKMHVCHECGYLTDGLNSFKRHVKTHKVYDYTYQEGMYFCNNEHCAYRVDSQKSMRHHIGGAHRSGHQQTLAMGCYANFRT